MLPPTVARGGVLLLLVFVLCLLSAAVPTHAQDAPLVNTTSGPVLGFYQTEEGNLTRAFLGIPFAAPPARFEVAKAPEPWTEPFNASSFPLPCAQSGVKGATSEDCLQLNVFTPSDAQAGDNLPVMVWIHGGRYWTGESDQYAGQYLSGNGRVVLVTIQYRLNVFGFFTLPELQANNSLSLGMQDQRLALHWVRNNIAAFGGNPKNVTLFGESAGAGSALLHLMINVPGETIPTEELFQQVILESTWQWILPTVSQGQTASLSWAAKKGCNQSTTAEVLDCMRGLSADTIRGSTLSTEINYFQPIIDGQMFLDQPLPLIKSGRYASNVKIMIGYNYDEGTFSTKSRIGGVPGNSTFNQSVYEIAVKNKSLSFWLSEDQMNQVLDWYKDNTAEVGYYYGTADILGDWYIICPSILAAPYMVEHAPDHTIYTYVWNYTSSDSTEPYQRASHGNEMPYVFNHSVYSNASLNEVDKALAYRMIQSWSAFATEGKPQSGWPAYNATNLLAFLWEQTSVDYDPNQAATIPFAQRGPLCQKWAEIFNVADPEPSTASAVRSLLSSLF